MNETLSEQSIHCAGMCRAVYETPGVRAIAVAPHGILCGSGDRSGMVQKEYLLDETVY